MVDPEARLLVRRSIHDHTVAVDPDNPLRLIPSVYVWPHVRVNCDAPYPLAVLYPPATCTAGSPDRAARRARHRAPGSADPTRLRILQLVGEQPRSTEELAPLVGLSESGLSKHLRALRTPACSRRSARATTCCTGSSAGSSPSSGTSCSATSASRSAVEA